MRKRFKESEIINLLRAIEVKISGGMVTEEACRSLGVSDKSYYRWRKLYGSMGRTEVKRCKDLEKENQRLRRIVSDLEVDKSILKEALDFFRAQGVGPEQVRDTVVHVRQRLGCSERRTCQVLDQPLSTQRHTSRRKVKDEEALRLALIRLAKQYGQYRHSKITALLSVEGCISTTRRSNACGAEKACRSQGATKPTSDHMTIHIPSSENVSCIRTTSGVWTLFKIGCFGDADTRCSPSSMNTHVSALQ